MFVETKFRPGGEVLVETDRQRLARLIRTGHELIGERHDAYWSDGKGCALVTALVGAGLKYEGDGANGIAKLLCMDSDFLVSVSLVHCVGIPRLKIADMLERGEL